MKIKNMEKIFKQPQESLLKTLPDQLTKNGYSDITATKDYIYAQGNIPVMLVAHLDTVHKSLPKNILWDKQNNVLTSPQGIGADDRAGVIAILDITARLKELKPFILFTTDEEIGGYGASAASKQIKPNVNFIIELDRKGYNDAVYYDCENLSFCDYIESFGFEYNYGSFSDISILCPRWKVAGVNLSIGYFKAHTKKEYLDITAMNKTISKVIQICQNIPNKKFKYVKIKNSYYDSMFYDLHYKI